jgi:ribosome maturation factor RimP
MSTIKLENLDAMKGAVEKVKSQKLAFETKDAENEIVFNQKADAAIIIQWC